MLLFLLFLAGNLRAAETAAWSEKDTRLATEYLNLLVEKPEYGRVLDLLWDLYDKNQSTAMLLDSIAGQAKAQSHPNVQLVYAHLLRKAGKNNEAQGIYEAVLGKDHHSAIALRALTDLALERGDREKTVTLLEELIQTYPADDAARIPLLVEKGRLAAEINKTEIAGAAWAEALRLRKNDAAFTREIAQLMVGAGLLDKALAIYRSVVKTSEPADKLNALYDLSRLEEQADHFDNAVQALRDGLALSHFKDWRYEEFFRRLVKLHERYGQLDTLKAQLLREAHAKPPQEKALLDMARFSEMTVDPEEQVKWLRELAKNFPEQPEHRWALVRALLDHDGQPEAARLLDEILKSDRTDNAALVLLRCEVYLRTGDTDQAVARLKSLFAAQGANTDVEKAVYKFAVTHALDNIVELVLRERLKADPSRQEPVFELASFLMKRQRVDEVDKIFEQWLGHLDALSLEDRRKRLREISSFYAANQNLDAAESYAKKAANGATAGREDLLQLADTTTQRGQGDEALPLLERAWKLSDTPEKRTDVDERILALLSGDQGTHGPPAASGNVEFRLPPLFTGEGFGSDAPVTEKRATITAAVRNYALSRADEALPGRWPPTLPMLGIPVPWNWVEQSRLILAQSYPQPPLDTVLRAAWWCLRANEIDLAMSLARRLMFDASGKRVEASLDAERLILEIAQEDKNPLLIVQQLRRLAKMDPANRVAYERRLAEHYIEESANPAPRTEHDHVVALSLRERATAILERLAHEDPTNEAVLSALAQCYAVMQKRDAVTSLWERAVHQAKGNVTPLLERYAEALITQHKFKEYVETQMRLLEEEADLKKRRDIFARAMERLMWADSLRGELAEDQKKSRLDLLAASVKSHSQRHPFDGFWFEAAARIEGRLGDSQKALAAMKQAYYTAPDTPFSLDQLRAAALDAGDLKSAIYFQKQIAATSAATDEAGEWRALVQLLEQDFRLAEADQVRRRLESRFSQDASSLEELAKYYQDTAQDDAARRVLEQITRVQSWQPTALLRLALAQERLGENTGAEATLRRMLAIPSMAEKNAAASPERLPWPLFDTHGEKAPKREGTLASLENAPELEESQRVKLRAFFSMPRPEFTVLPDEAAASRLRAVEELAHLHPEPWDAKQMEALHLSEMERAWLYFHAGRGVEFRAILSQRLGQTNDLEGLFVFAWLQVKSHGMDETVQWVHSGKTDEEREQRKELVHAVISILAEEPQFEFSDTDFVTLGQSHLLANTDLIGLSRKLQGRQQNRQALLLAQAIKATAPMLFPADSLLLAKIAETAGDKNAERSFLHDAWSQPLETERPSAFDPFFQSFAKLLQLSSTPAEREKLMMETWKRLSAALPSGQNALRKARFLAVVGAQGASAQRLVDILSKDFITARSFVDPIPGRYPPGVLPSGPRVDELNHMHGYWDDLREWDDVLGQDGLSRQLAAVEGKVFARNGGTFLGPRATFEYTGWRNQLLAHRMRVANYPERLRLLREHLAGDDSVETLGELGKFLETQGLARECIEVYRQLPDRAPSNTEYCKQFLTVCDQAWDYDAAIPYILKLFVADPQFRPQNIEEGYLEEKHAQFLARLHETAQLRSLAFRPPSPLKTNRVPEAVPYLRELAPLLEREGDQAGALAAWEQLAQVWPQDEEAGVRRAKLLVAQGQRERALEALRKMPVGNFWNEAVQQGVNLRAKLVADAGLWDEMRLLMNLVADGDRKPGSTPEERVPSVIAVSRLLAEHQRAADAQSLLVRAERAVKDDAPRFQLRLEELRLSSQDAAWTPAKDGARIAALLRAPIASEAPLKSLVEWLGGEAKSSRVSAWLGLLKDSRPSPNSALALAALGLAGQVESRHFTSVRWEGEATLMGAPRRLVIKQLLEHHQPALARALVFQDDPLLVSIFVAQGDELALRELFSRLTREAFPGGIEVVDYAEALAREGHSGLADELYGLAMDRLHATGGSLPPLVKSYARFLIQQRRFEQAETLLMRDSQGLTDGLPPILVDLYRGWNKLDRLDAELVKFYLPGGVREETRFLARKTPHAPP